MKLEAIIKLHAMAVIIGSLTFFAGSSAYAQDTAGPPVASETPAPAVTPTINIETDSVKIESKDGPTRDFAGISFGVGVSATFDLGSNDRITEAERVNGVVRVTDQDNILARIMLESHYFFEPTGPVPFTNKSNKYWGYGPFIALQPGTDEIIESIGAGWMWGFRKDNKSNQSFNIGVGVTFDPNTQTLGDGIVDGQPLPEGETEVRFLEQDQVGLLVLTSFSF